MDNEKFRRFVHDKLFELMQFVDGVCKKENISYSLTGGSMLGAVRHDGFIPWDDDVDIVMKRDDFEKLPNLRTITTTCCSAKIGITPISI